VLTLLANRALSMHIRVTSLILAAALSASASLSAAEPKASDWKAGIAVQVITPDRPMWMSGMSWSRKFDRTTPAANDCPQLLYASHTKPEARAGKIAVCLATARHNALPLSAGRMRQR
jgi:hypothetical protein